MKTVLAIPAYNCASQLKRVLKAIAEDKDLVERLHKIIVIDNISLDNTVEIATNYRSKIKKLRILRNKKNISLGGSHKVAFLYAEKVGATHVAILHGDDQAVASELHGLLDIAEQNRQLDAVLGSRFMRGSHLQGYDWKRIFGNRVLNLLYTLLCFRRIKDLGSGLNVFKLEVFNDHIYLEFANKLTFNFELLLYLIGNKAKLHFHPITWRESDQVSNARNFNIAATAFSNLIKWRFGKLKYKNTQNASSYESEEVS